MADHSVKLKPCERAAFAGLFLCSQRDGAGLQTARAAADTAAANAYDAHALEQTIETWQQLVNEPALQVAAADCDARDVSQIARLRKKWSFDLVQAALDWAKAGKLIEQKGWSAAATGREPFIADAEGMQQATARVAAEHKAQRFVAAREAMGEAEALDLCCGCGADLTAMAAAGLSVTGVDRQPLRAWMAGQNSGAPTLAAEIDSVDVRGRLVHIDPSRRAEASGPHGTKRKWKLEDYEPSPTVVAELIGKAAGVGVALGPGVEIVELTTLLSDCRGPAAIELLSLHGSLIQAMLWTGVLAEAIGQVQALRDEAAGQGSRAAVGVEAALLATRLPEGATLGRWVADLGAPGATVSPYMPLAEPAGYIFAVDPAVDRFGLMAALCEQTGLAAVHPSLGVLTGDEDPQSPWLTAFELIEVMPWRPKKVKQRLTALGAGIVEVKTRGRAVDPNQAQKQLRGKGDQLLTVFVLRLDKQVQAWITRRVNTQSKEQTP